MNTPSELESLYQQALSALKARDYARAAELLKRILVLDENYKDASRLLARIVKIGRRRWYNDLRIWGPAIGVVLIGLLAWLAPKITLPPQVAQPATSPSIPTVATPLTETPTPTRMATVAPTLIPLTWKRLSLGLEFPRDGISVIAIDLKDPEVMYAGTTHAGIYKSIDGGTSWQPAQTGLGAGGIEALVIDPQDHLTLYAAVFAAGVYKSTDGGATWQSMNNGIYSLDASSATGVFISPLDSQTLYFLDNGDDLSRVYRSKDGGASWSRQNSGPCPYDIRWLAVHPIEPETLFASVTGLDSNCTGGIYKSTDGGITWTITSFGVNGLLYIDQQDGQYLYALSGQELFGSSDSGNTWRLLTSTSDPFFTTCSIHPEDGTGIMCGGTSGAIQSSKDAGQSWQSLTSFTNNGIRALYYLPEMHDEILALGQGIHISGDGGNSWDIVNSGLGSGPLRLTLNPSNPDSIYIEGPGVRPWEGVPLYHSSNAGRIWALVSDDASSFEIDADGITLYRSGYGVIDKSLDEGGSWIPMQVPMVEQSDISAHPAQPGRIYLLFDTDPAHLYISTNGGETWQEDSLPDISLTLDRTKFVYSQEQKMYLATYSGGILRSSDNGYTWTACNAVDGYILDMVVDPRHYWRTYLATKGNGILTSEDFCQSWQTSNAGLDNLFVNTLAIDPNTPDTIYAGTDGGAYISFDGGDTWSQVNDGLLGATVVYSIVADKDSNVYAATPYGIFKLEGK